VRLLSPKASTWLTAALILTALVLLAAYLSHTTDIVAIAAVGAVSRSWVARNPGVPRRWRSTGPR